MNDTESEYIGRPLADAPTREPTSEDCMGKKKQKRDGEVVRDSEGNALFGGWCRCWPGKGTDHVGEGRCKLHAGSAGGPAGAENGNWKHGLYSDVIRPEDRDALDAIEGMSTRAKLESTLNLQVLKLRRAVESMEDSSQNEFWDAFAHLVEEIEHPEDADLRSLAQMLGQNDRAIREWMDLIRKTAKDLHKVTDGEVVKHEHGVDSDELEELKGMAEDMF